jgi:hypothetical protein
MDETRHQNRKHDPRYPEFGLIIRDLIGALRKGRNVSVGVIDEELATGIDTSVPVLRKFKSGERCITDQNMLDKLAHIAKEKAGFGRDWGKKLCVSAGYRGKEAVEFVNRVWEPVPTRTIPSCLPWHDAASFVDRPVLLAQILQALAVQSYQGVVLAGVSGSGKTRAMAEAAYRCAAVSSGELEENAVPTFDAVVWIDLDDLLWASFQEGGQNIRPDLVAAVIDTIAQTLGYWERAGSLVLERVRIIDKALREQRVLVILDNVNTVQHGEVLRWATRMPFPSKVVLISTERLYWLAQSCMIISVDGMNREEAGRLIEMNVDKLDLRPLLPHSSGELASLIEATNGNPKALEMALGQLKYRNLCLADVVSDLEHGGNILEALCRRSWALVAPTTLAHETLTAATLFVGSASVEAIEAVTGSDSGMLDNALGRLEELSLLTVERPDIHSKPRYGIHPLVRRFARAQLATRPNMETVMRSRWVDWYVRRAQMVGYCPTESERLTLLEGEEATLRAVIAWTEAAGEHAKTLAIASGSSYYFYIRGFWDARIAMIGATAAHVLGDRVTEALLLSYYTQTLVRQGDLAEAYTQLSILIAMLDDESLPQNVHYEVQYTRGRLAHEQGDHITAAALLSELLPHVRLGVPNLKWHVVALAIADCYLHMGDDKAAAALLDEIRNDADAIGFQSANLQARIYQARILMNQFENADKAVAADELESLLSDLAAAVSAHKMSELMRHVWHLQMRFHRAQGNIPGAVAALEAEMDCLNRLGNVRAYAEAANILKTLMTSQSGR